MDFFIKIKKTNVKPIRNYFNSEQQKLFETVTLLPDLDGLIDFDLRP